jgi:hypothetical protein
MAYLGQQTCKSNLSTTANKIMKILKVTDRAQEYKRVACDPTTWEAEFRRVSVRG